MSPLWAVTGACLLFATVAGIMKYARRRAGATRLRGPPSPSFVYGCAKVVQEADDHALPFEQWANEFGPVYNLPSPMGASVVVVMDPKAIAHIYGRDTYGYHQMPLGRVLLERVAGRGLLWSEGDSHKRQRKTLTPGFSNVGIRNMTPVFYDSAYKLVAAWDAIFDSEVQALIDVQTWMNRVSLDSLGLAGFSYEFGTLQRRPSKMSDILDAFGYVKVSLIGSIAFILSPSIPVLLRIPTARGRLVREFKAETTAIANELMNHGAANSERNELKPLMDKDDKSVIGLLIKSCQTTSPGLHVTKEEVISQIRFLILAGYETTSISLTWALIELAKQPKYQTRLREELQSQFPTSDPTWEQLTYGLPLLDAVVHEILRMHPAVHETFREAQEDDVLPLGTTIIAASGEVIDRVRIAKGTIITIATASLQRSAAIWGEDAKEFNPERWLDRGKGFTEDVKEVQGHRHLITFADGPRTCLGRSFALAELKVVLSVLIKTYEFELRDGPGTKLGRHRSFLWRPKVKGESGQAVPMIVRKIER